MLRVKQKYTILLKKNSQELDQTYGINGNQTLINSILMLLPILIISKYPLLN